MSKAPSPLLGYNNNVRHKSRVFHIQTEDSGVKHPHIITHLFMDGGRILKSVKKSYAEHLDSEGLADVVRQMMKEQHKAMFIALRGGQFDHLVDAAADGQPASLRQAPAAAKAPSKSPASSASASAESAEGAPAAARDAAASDAAASDAAAPSSPPLSSPPVSAPAAPVSAPAAPVSAPPAPVSAPPMSGLDLKVPSSSPETVRMAGPPSGLEARLDGQTELTLDIDALERTTENVAAIIDTSNDLAPALFKSKADSLRFRHPSGKETRATAALLSASHPSSSARHKAAAPSPPAGLVVPKVTLSEWTTKVTPDVTPPPPPPKTATPHSKSLETPSKSLDREPPSSRPGRPVVPVSTPTEGRYAPARPAAIFGHARPQQGSSIFGEDLISDKSLDEVILSYLAEDLETEKK